MKPPADTDIAARIGHLERNLASMSSQLTAYATSMEQAVNLLTASYQHTLAQVQVLHEEVARLARGEAQK